MAKPIEHEIRYGGGPKHGYRWACTCGESSDMMRSWADPYDRTEEAHDHLLKVGARVLDANYRLVKPGKASMRGTTGGET